MNQAREPFVNTPYLYYNMKIKVKVDRAEDAIGSRGWGFWNTAMPAQCIWFINSKGRDFSGKPYAANGFFANVSGFDENGKYYITGAKLPDLDNEAHVYEITWAKDKIQFLVDGKVVYTETTRIPSIPMSFHSWVDNVVYESNEKGEIMMLYDFFNGTQSQDIFYLEITQN